MNSYRFSKFSFLFPVFCWVTAAAGASAIDAERDSRLLNDSVRLRFDVVAVNSLRTP